MSEQGLRGAEIFKDLDDNEVQRIARLFSTERVAAGVCIFRQGAPSDAFYLIEEGTLECVRETDGTRLAGLGAGEYFGEFGLIEGKPRSASVWSRTPCVLLKILKKDLLDILTTHPSIAWQIHMVSVERHRANAATTSSRQAAPQIAQRGYQPV